MDELPEWAPAGLEERCRVDVDCRRALDLEAEEPVAWSSHSGELSVVDGVGGRLEGVAHELSMLRRLGHHVLEDLVDVNVCAVSLDPASESACRCWYCPDELGPMVIESEASWIRRRETLARRPPRNEPESRFFVVLVDVGQQLHVVLLVCPEGLRREGRWGDGDELEGFGKR